MNRISVCLAAAAVALASTAAAGVDFAQMPKGCTWVVSHSNGAVWRSTFLGWKGGAYVVRTTEAADPGKRVNETRFDKHGRMISRDWGGGNWEKFVPYSCYDEPGTCTNRFTNADGADLVMVSTHKRKGDGAVISARVKDGETFDTERVKYGPFNLAIRNWSRNFSNTTGQFQDCGLSS